MEQITRYCKALNDIVKYHHEANSKCFGMDEMAKIAQEALMTDRDGLQAFESWISQERKKYYCSPYEIAWAKKAWVQGVAWGRQNPVEKQAHDGKTDQEKLDKWMSRYIQQREEIARMRAALIDIRLHVKQAGGNAKLRPRFLMDAVNRGLGEDSEEMFMAHEKNVKVFTLDSVDDMHEAWDVAKQDDRRVLEEIRDAIHDGKGHLVLDIINRELEEDKP